MPANPAALKSWVTRWLVHYVSAADQAHGKPPVSAAQVDLVEPLSALLCQTPVGPRVRAAAFRVLASLPGIKRFQSPGGQGLLLPEGSGLYVKMVIDPSTSLVRSVVYAAPRRAARNTGESSRSWQPTGRTRSPDSGCAAASGRAGSLRPARVSRFAPLPSRLAVSVIVMTVSRVRSVFHGRVSHPLCPSGAGTRPAGADLDPARYWLRGERRSAGG